MTIDLDAVARERGIKYFVISFTDLIGVQRAKLVPAQAIGATASLDSGGNIVIVLS